MKAIKRVIGMLLAAALSACAAQPAAVVTRPVPVQQAAPLEASPLVASSGLVIGTMSYHYVNVAGNDAWVVHLQRVDTREAGDYALPVSVDNARHRGVFTGTLPAGVYSFREAAAAGHRYVASAVYMPFEVQAGEVRDAGHYALDPVSAEQ